MCVFALQPSFFIFCAALILSSLYFCVLYLSLLSYIDCKDVITSSCRDTMHGTVNSYGVAGSVKISKHPFNPIRLITAVRAPCGAKKSLRGGQILERGFEKLNNFTENIFPDWFQLS